MRIFAYCDKRYEQATKKVVGWQALMLTSPPILGYSIVPEWFADHDLIYLDLHGQPSSVYLYSGPNEQWNALSLKSVEQMNLREAIVFATSCYLPQTRFIDTFLAAGARAVIAGEGENYGGRKRIAGAQSLAKALIEVMSENNEAPDTMLMRAKLKLNSFWFRLNPGRDIQDAMEFRAWARS